MPLGVEPRLKHIRDEGRLSEVRERYALRRAFILYVGMIEPRKNLENLVDAYLSSSLPKRCDLVLAGSWGWGYANLLGKIGGSKVRDCVLTPGPIEDNDLPALYSAATAFVYPSRYEGFGLPVLEAMACGTPVITSSTSSLPRIAGAAAILVDPDDRNALASSLQSIMNSAAL